MHIDRRALIGLAPALALPVLGLSACKKADQAVPDDMSMGNPAAKVTVIEYASVACPFCGRWDREVFPAFKAKYIDTGKIHYVFREMLVGPDSEVASAAAGFLLARCAGKDKYFSVTEAIFHNQDGLRDDPRGTLLNVAKSAGLTEAQFDACINDDAAMLALNKRVQGYAKNNNVTSTPTFVINGKALEPGFHPLTDLDAAIAQAQSAG